MKCEMIADMLMLCMLTFEAQVMRCQGYVCM